MTWICAYCGCENENDDRIGRREPQCGRCKNERIDPDDLRKNSDESYHRLKDRISEIESEIMDLEEEADSLREEASKIKRSPVYFNKIRVIADDQKTLFDGVMG